MGWGVTPYVWMDDPPPHFPHLHPTASYATSLPPRIAQFDFPLHILQLPGGTGGSSAEVLSQGAIAGIAIGATAFVALAAAGIFYCRGGAAKCW